MTVQLPEAPAPGVGWRFLDFLAPDGLAKKADNTGVATVTFDPVDSDRMWQVTRAVISNDGNVECSMRLYVVTAGADIRPAALRSGSDSGLFDEADYPGDGLWVLTGQQLIAQWTGAAGGSTSTCALQYRLLGR